MNTPKGMMVDHRNHDTLDNTKSNLKNVSMMENQQNRKGITSRNTSGFLGVCWYKQTNRWKASIRKNGRTISLGYYKDANEAGAVAHEARVKMFSNYQVESLMRNKKRMGMGE